MIALVFARAKTGKTLDAALSFPKARFFCYDPAGLYSAQTLYGHKPTAVKTPTFQDVTEALEAGFPEAVAVIDDLTLMARATEEKVQQSVKGLLVYNKVRDVAVRMVEAARATGKVIILNGHEREARTNHTGKFIRGGIDLPMTLTEAFTALVDFAARGAKLDPDLHGFTIMHPHPAVYLAANGSTDWAVGSRLGVPAVVPMNLGEIFRSSGLCQPERILPWQEKVVGQLTAKLDAAPNIARTILKEAYANLRAKGVLDAHVLWTLRDAEDRHLIRQLKGGLSAVYTAQDPV
jgi:hypothetical protein